VPALAVGVGPQQVACPARPEKKYVVDSEERGRDTEAM
jgi:hypothetical protein